MPPLKVLNATGDPVIIKHWSCLPTRCPYFEVAEPINKVVARPSPLKLFNTMRAVLRSVACKAGISLKLFYGFTFFI